MRNLYDSRVPGGADLVTYWYEKARAHIEAGKARRVGLLATNSLRGGANREVLKRIKDSGDIFMAWADRPWILEGAAVRVSMVGFDNGSEPYKVLDGTTVDNINSDLTSLLDITVSKKLPSNQSVAFQGPVKVGAFDISGEIAVPMFEANSRNSDVIKPYMNGDDIVKRPRNYWLIDFALRTESEASKYLEPFHYVVENIKPQRLKNNDRQRRENWWRLGRSGEDYKQAVNGLKRQILTPRVAKHRVFVWVETDVMPSDATVAIARDDDYFFGVLHSKLHEVWSLRMGTWLGKGNDPRYTPTTTFETFSFPWPPGHEDTASPAYHAISDAARQLHEERDAWLNPPTRSEKALKDRTLTNLYNALNAWRGKETIKVVKPAAGDFALQLDELHLALDRAVCDAYGWGDMGGEGYDFNVYTDEGEEEILRRLLALNLERADRQ